MTRDTITYSQVVDILEQNKELEARLSITSTELAKVERMFTTLTFRYAALTAYVKTLSPESLAESPTQQRRSYAPEHIDYIARRREADSGAANSLPQNPAELADLPGTLRYLRNGACHKGSDPMSTLQLPT